MVVRPNFFIVGAPKAGTTAMYEYLRTHPEICMPACKEPQYFATDLLQESSVRTEDEYLKLFRSCASSKAIGEASVWYLYSEVAIKKIYAFNPGARIIVMLRNPVDLVHALHRQLLFSFMETERDFERAWLLQDSRAKGRSIPSTCPASQMLQYRRVGCLATQLIKVFEVFPREQVLVLFFDDLVTDPHSLYEQALKFLGVSQDGRMQFPVVNESRSHRAQWIGRLSQAPPWPLPALARGLRTRFGISFETPLKCLRRLSQIPRKRSPIRPDFRRQLQTDFTDEVKKLESLTGRQLGAWLT